MYLNAKKFIWTFDHENEPNREKVKTALENGGMKLLKGSLPKEVSFEVGYWRKANQIHQWFVENVQGGEDDCEEYDVSLDQLKQLLDICKKVLEDKSLAEQLLPVQEGFFFGSYEYDDWYFEDIQQTIKIIENILSNDEDVLRWYDFTYRSSW